MTGYTGIAVCTNWRFGQKSCGGSGGEEIAAALEEALAEAGLDIPVERIQCFGHCAKGPNVRLLPGGPFFHQVSEDDLQEIVDALRERRP